LVDPIDARIIAVSGMRFEAQAAAGLGITCVYGLVAAEIEARLCALIEQLRREPPKGLMSFGTMGGLAPDIETGQWLVARSVIDPAGGTHYTDPGWSTTLLRLCRTARYAPVMSSDSKASREAPDSSDDGRLRGRHGVAYRGARRATLSAAVCGGTRGA
jgi:hypothetical protein